MGYENNDKRKLKQSTNTLISVFRLSKAVHKGLVSQHDMYFNVKTQMVVQKLSANVL
jgi:hypothetical protein